MKYTIYLCNQSEAKFIDITFTYMLYILQFEYTPQLPIGFMLHFA